MKLKSSETNISYDDYRLTDVPAGYLHITDNKDIYLSDLAGWEKFYKYSTKNNSIESTVTLNDVDDCSSALCRNELYCYRLGDSFFNDTGLQIKQVISKINFTKQNYEDIIELNYFEKSSLGPECCSYLFESDGYLYDSIINKTKTGIEVIKINTVNKKYTILYKSSDYNFFDTRVLMKFNDKLYLAINTGFYKIINSNTVSKINSTTTDIRKTIGNRFFYRDKMIVEGASGNVIIAKFNESNNSFTKIGNYKVTKFGEFNNKSKGIPTISNNIFKIFNKTIYESV